MPAGQKKFRNLFQQYLERSDFAIAVFDLTNFESFHNAKEWILGKKCRDIQKYETKRKKP
jgi:GTPase SAR1 family protein